MKINEILDASGKKVELNAKEIACCKAFEPKFNRALIMNDTTGLGANIDITTFTTILKSISTQKFYEIDIERYMPVDTDGGWAQQILQVREYLVAKPMEGFGGQSAHGAKMAVAEAAVDGIFVPSLTWKKQVEYSIEELNQAALLGNFNLIAAKERSRKKSHDLDMQQLSFLGFDKLKGLLNQSDVVTSATGLITKKISEMTYSEMNTLIATLLETYRNNCDRTVYPNKFVIPENDYNGLGSQVSAEFPIKTKLQLLQEVLDTMCMKHVDILPCVYGDKRYNSLNVNRYALYNSDFDTLRLQKGIDYTPTMMNTIDGWNLVNTAFARTFGVLINRPKEVLYIDRQAD